jgi:ribose 5-phosphate isomerase RpiB
MLSEVDDTKAYILSENESHGIAMANAINAAGNTAIMAEHGSNDYTDLISQAAEGLNYGYDLTLLLTTKPLEASIAANKTNKLRAVVCNTQADASKARKARANIIIMDDDEFSKASATNIMRGWLGATPESSEEDNEPEKSVGIAEAGKSAFGILSSSVSMLKKPTRTKAKVEKEEVEEGEDIKRPKGGGLIKQIKYTFGIE